MRQSTLQRLLGFVLALACVTFIASAGRAAAPLSTSAHAELAIAVTVVRSCAVGTARLLPTLGVSARQTLIQESYATLKATCAVEDAHIELGSARVQSGSADSTLLDVEF